MSEVTTSGRAWDSEKGVVVFTTRPDIPNLSSDVTVMWHDCRCISPEQRRKAWALMTEIAAYQGQDKEETYHEQQTAFSLKHLELLQGELFHLSTATMSTARAFINLLIEIIVENGIKTKEPLVQMCEDIGRYVYVCAVNRRCAVCGQRAELHHSETVGMGFNRKEICHLGMKCLPLCRTHHQNAHTVGENVFQRKYHLQAVEIDERIAKVYRLKTT